MRSNLNTLNIAEIVEIKKSFRTTPLQWSSLNPTLILIPQSAEVLNNSKN